MSGQTEFSRTVSLGPWRTRETSVCSLPHHSLCNHLVCLEGKRKQLHVVLAGGYTHAKFSCCCLNVTLKCRKSFPCPVSSRTDTFSAIKLINLKSHVCRCVFLLAADKPGIQSGSVFLVTHGKLYQIACLFFCCFFFNVGIEVRHAKTKHRWITSRCQFGWPTCFPRTCSVFTLQIYFIL